MSIPGLRYINLFFFCFFYPMTKIVSFSSAFSIATFPLANIYIDYAGISVKK